MKETTPATIKNAYWEAMRRALALRHLELVALSEAAEYHPDHNKGLYWNERRREFTVK